MYHDRINEFTDRLENNAQGYISAEDVFLSLDTFIKGLKGGI